MTDEPPGNEDRVSLPSRWSLAKQRISRRHLLEAGGASATGLLGLTIVGCGDDDEEQPTAAEAAPAQEAAPAAEPTEVDEERDLVVAQAALMVTLDQEFSAEHETQEAQVNQGARLIRQKYIPDPLGSGWDRQDLSGTPDSFEPELAESFPTVSDDGLEYTFKIKRGVISPAGNEFTVDDVVYTFQRRVGVGAIGAFIMVVSLAMPDLDPNRIQRVDDDHVKFTLEFPFETFLHSIANAHGGTIVDSKLLQANATEEDPWALKFASQESHGFGAFSLESFTAGDEAVWKTNPNYVHGPPNFDRMIWRLAPESSTRLSFVQQGDVHIAKQMLAREQEVAEGEEGLQVPALQTNLMVMGPLKSADVPELDDLRARQAFLHTIPYEEIINTVYRGRGSRAFGVISPVVPGYAGEKHYGGYQLDIQKARDLLAEAGFSDGFSFDFGFSLTTPDQEQVAILMRDSAADAGITLNLVGLTSAALNEAHSTAGGTIPHVVRDFAIYQTVPYILTFSTTPFSPGNWPGYGHDPAADNFEKYWDAVQRGIAVGDDDSPEALTAWDEAQQWLAADSPYFYINTLQPAWILRSNVTGYTHRSDNVLDYGRMRLA